MCRSLHICCQSLFFVVYCTKESFSTFKVYELCLRPITVSSLSNSEALDLQILVHSLGMVKWYMHYTWIRLSLSCWKWRSQICCTWRDPFSDMILLHVSSSIPRKTTCPKRKALSPGLFLCHGEVSLVMYYEVTQYLLCLAMLLQIMGTLQISTHTQALALRWHHLAKKASQPCEDWFSQQEIFMALPWVSEKSPRSFQSFAMLSLRNGNLLRYIYIYI